MSAAYAVAAIGNAIVDVIAPASDSFLEAQSLPKGGMTLVDADRSTALYEAMQAGVETSGGSAANTVAGVASFGGQAVFMGKVADDALGRVFAEDIRNVGAHFTTTPLAGGPATARCMINVTPDGDRTMATFLGAAVELGPDDIDAATIAAAEVTYLEGYLFDAPRARRAFAIAAATARAAGRRVAITLSDGFVADRWRAELIGFFPQVDIVFANADEVAALYQTKDFEAAAEKLAGAVDIAVITRGPRGSRVCANGRAHDVQAFPVDKVVDTTGAGDQYAAGFLFGLSRGAPVEVCGRLGSLAASEVIAHYGPRPQSPLAALAARHGLSL